MTLFRQQLHDDLHTVFFNPAEFGEHVELAGHADVPCVYEPLEMAMPSGSDGRNAVSYEGVTIYVAARDVPDTLLAGRATTFRGERWFVLDADAHETMRTIRLYRERS